MKDAIFAGRGTQGKGEGKPQACERFRGETDKMLETGKAMVLITGNFYPLFKGLAGY